MTNLTESVSRSDADAADEVLRNNGSEKSEAGKPPVLKNESEKAVSVGGGNRTEENGCNSELNQNTSSGISKRKNVQPQGSQNSSVSTSKNSHSNLSKSVVTQRKAVTITIENIKSLSNTTKNKNNSSS